MSIFGFPFATLSPITVIPGNLPEITSKSVVAAGEIVNPAEGLDILLFCVPHEQIVISAITCIIVFNFTKRLIANPMPLIELIKYDYL